MRRPCGVHVFSDPTLLDHAAGRCRGDDPRPVTRTDAGPPDRIRVAYLTNVYPKTSHSFIRTEIEALTRAGIEVERITIRRSEDVLVDPRDVAEAGRTAALLDGNHLGLALSGLRLFARSPLRAVAALRLAMTGAGAPDLLRALVYFAEAAVLAERMRRAGVRHVHVHFGTNPAAVARIASRMGPLTYSFTVHGPDEFDAPLALELPGKIADAAFVAGVSDYGRGQLMRWSDTRHWRRIEVVRCSVARSFLESVPASVDADSRTLVCVARLSAQKGITLLVEAAALIARDQRFEIRLIGDGEQRATIEKRIAELGLADRVRLLGWRSSDEVRREIAAARALILPSFAEGLPIVLMEALALGRPVVATAIAGVPELVDARNGWLIPSGSVDALADALRAVLRADPERLRAMGAVGRERVLRLHDPDRNAARMADLLRRHA